jgi:hypothetical protein
MPLPTLFSSVTYAHIFFGSLAIATFWIVAVSNKGTVWHRIVGRGFVMGMYGIAFTGFAMSTFVLFDPTSIHRGIPSDESLEATMFLSYLGFASLTTARNGVLRVRSRNQPAQLKSFLSLSLNTLTFALGLASLAYGVRTESPLFMAMSTVGLSIGGGYLLSLRKNASWRLEHISAMVGGGIAAHTGLIAGGGARYMPDFIRSLGLVAWLMPTIIGTLLTVYWVRVNRSERK